MKLELEIIEAEPCDAAELTRIAHGAKRHWGYPERWIQKWSGILTITPEYIQTNLVFVAKRNGRAIGFGAMEAFHAGLRFDHLWVLPHCLNQGVGRRLFEHGMAVASARKSKTIEIEADPNAEAFYLKMGAVKTGQIITELDGQPRILPQLRVDVPRWMADH